MIASPPRMSHLPQESGATIVPFATARIAIRYRDAAVITFNVDAGVPS
ncbi:hypothetical protein [Afipia broomeae]|uniref:Uncharacterized protein n=1 Tax=Afipia broomeae ATCC 49717 TaxID=883078 RepID=K8PMY3_9BRAD|nr:hypothetical protein [Afipia broomeae]EKS42149.1 hypothetical protein HMPREF9695_01241 [Afipia broomeae ATCC 49717]